MHDDSWTIWMRAAAREDISAGITRLYADLETLIAQRRPRCDASGRCCRFEEFGHRLYVTALEIAWVLRQYALRPAGATAATSPATPLLSRSLPVLDARPGGACPFQVDKLCGIHPIRPLGCRIFFCDKSTDAWQHELYEQFLTRLRALHDAHRLPYRYLEWRTGLREARKAMGSASN